MQKVLIIAILLSCIDIHLHAQPVRNDAALISKIKLMYKDDQFWRKEYAKVSNKKKSDYSEETIQEKWEEADSLNEIKAKAIIKQYGYPGYDLVGGSSDDFWAIIQHCDDDVAFQEKVLILMKKQVDKNNASKPNYAYLTDRVLVNKNQKQVYGTQLQRDKKTGKFSPSH